MVWTRGKIKGTCKGYVEEVSLYRSLPARGMVWIRKKCLENQIPHLKVKQQVIKMRN